MLDNLWLVIRNAAMIVLFPGTVVVYVPYRLLTSYPAPEFAPFSLARYLAVLVVAAGTAILLTSIWSFARVGRGTLAPFDETKKLIVVGLYRYVRNPMYIGVLFILLGEALFFRSSALLLYACLCFVVANVLIIGYEEHRLRHKYGDEFQRYCARVGRWMPGKPYDRT